MTGEHSWRWGSRCAAAVIAIALACVVGLGAPVSAQTTGTPATCMVGGRPCFTAAQQQQIVKFDDDVMARRVAADSPVSAVVRAFVDYWVGYSVALGHTLAFSYLPG